jgi:hypothetical protein
MSFIDTIALPLFILIVGLVALIAVGTRGWAMVSEARARKLTSKCNLKLERQMAQFIETVFIETSSTNSDAWLPVELSDELWELHNQIDQHKELTR